MQFFTPVNTDSGGFRLGLEQQVMMLGSCFVENIGSRLVENKFRVMLNPFGVLYNPMSIIQSLDRVARHCLRPCPLTEADIFYDGQMWYSWLFSSEYAASTSTALLAKLNAALDRSAEVLRRLDVLFLTFGTNRYYRLKSSGTIVANCHKQPQSLFSEESLDVDDIVGAWRDVARRLHALRPALKVVFTVSPYRYVKYGLHESRVGKAVLLLATDRILKDAEQAPEKAEKTSGEIQKTSGEIQKRSRCFSAPSEGVSMVSGNAFSGRDSERPECRSEQPADGEKGLTYYYFPAYEIMNDELRDYRFYAPDMVHPSSQAADYLWERFLCDWADDSAQTFVGEWQPVLKGLNHRPFQSQSESYRNFLLNLRQKISALREKYPNLALRNEERTLSQRLSLFSAPSDTGMEAPAEPL